MGITGLLPFLEKATRPCHISEFKGGTVAIDSYCWLHKGANACAEQLARGEDNQQYVHFCLKYIKMLLSYDIHPIVVLDGRNLPAKAETESKRREARKNAKQRAAELLRLGKTEEARTYLRQCIDITPKMAHNLIKACQKLNVDCIVAPYESDAQLAFFNIKDIADVVITEDSDLVLFGCNKVLYKLDINGTGQLVEADKIYLAMEMRPDKYTFDKFRYMCILSGCDYINSLKGIGLKKAQKFVTLTAESNPKIFLKKIPRYLNMHHLVITDDYINEFLIADATFLHQTVFDPFKRKLVPLRDPEVTGTNPEFCKNAGEKFDDTKAYQVAIGNLNPYNFEKIDNWFPPPTTGPYSIWSGVCRKKISKSQKAEEKKHIMSFLTPNTRHVTLSSSSTQRFSEEQIRFEEDKQLEKELEFYTKPVPEMFEEKIEEKVEERMSPVIIKNPFVVKKKLSKFPLTNTPSKVITKSRYFSKSVETVNTKEKENGESSDIKNLNTSNTEFHFHEIELVSEKISLEEIVEKIDLEKVEERTSPVIIKNPFVIKKKLSKFSLTNTPNKIIPRSKYFSKSVETVNTKETENGESSDIENLNTSNTEFHSQEIELASKKRSLEEIVEKIDLTDNAKTETIVIQSQKETNSQPANSQTDSKKRKLGPCRAVGLQKKSTSQKTIRHFFTQMKKD